MGPNLRVPGIGLGGLALIVLLGVPLSGCDTSEDNPFVNTYIVKLGAEPGEVVESVNLIQNDFAEIFEFEPLHIFQEATQGFQVRLPIGIVESIEGLDEVEYVIIDNPDEYSPPYDGEAPDLGDEVPPGLAAIGWDPLLIGDLSNVEVAVVDTGVDLDHDDLVVVGTYDAVGEAGGEDSGGDDLNGHGTHVAGTIGAVSDGAGVLGVAPGVGIHAVRVLDADGAGTLGDIIAGLEYVLTYAKDNPDTRLVVNMSLGGKASPTEVPTVGEAIESLIDAGVVVCVAAGNEGEDTAGYIPAGYDLGLVVSAYDADGGYNGFAGFSNYGGEVDVAAPGVNITSTFPSGDYAALSGTSMATPHVAGAAAAYLALNGDDSPDEVEEAIVDSADDTYADPADDHPEGLLDLAVLLQ